MSATLTTDDLIGTRVRLGATSIVGFVTAASTPGFVIVTADSGLRIPYAVVGLDLL